MLNWIWETTRDFFRGILIIAGMFALGFIASVGWQFAEMLF